MGKEFYTQEVQYKEGRAEDRAELASLREQLHGYIDVENHLDAAIRACAEGPSARLAGLGERSDDMDGVQSVDQAVLLGTTLASAPSSAQRRIQQSLLLAQELQKRT